MCVCVCVCVLYVVRSCEVRCILCDLVLLFLAEEVETLLVSFFSQSLLAALSYKEVGYWLFPFARLHLSHPEHSLIHMTQHI